LSEKPRKNRERSSPGLALLPELVFEEIYGYNTDTKENGPVYARSDDLSSFKPTLAHNGTVYRVQNPSQIAWKLAGEPTGYASEAGLYEDLKHYLKRHVELRDPRYYDVTSAFSKATQRYPDYRAFPYIWAMAPYGSGKTTFLEVLNEICYRATIYGSGSAAGLSRLVDRYGCTCLVDEAQVNEDPKEKSELQALFNVGYRPSGKRLITSKPGEMDWTPRFLSLYSPKVMGSTHPPWPALESRCLIFRMAKTSRKDLDPTLTPQMYLEGSHLRSQLLHYRFNHLGDHPPERFEDLDKRISDARIRELGLPLLDVCPEYAREDILSYLEDLENERTANEHTSEEAAYVEAVLNCQSLGPDISTRQIREQLVFTLELEERKFLPSPKKITQNLKALGFKTTKHAGPDRTLRGIIYDTELVKRLVDRYITEPTSHTPESAPSAQSAPGLSQGGAHGADGAHSEGNSASRGIREDLENIPLRHQNINRETVKCEYCKQPMTRAEYIKHECPVGETLAELM
jgi:hypothetical protein